MLLLLLLSRFSRVRLCATPETPAHQAPPSLGFSRQEHWSGLPFHSSIILVKTKALEIYAYLYLKQCYQKIHVKALLFKGSQNKYFHKNVIHYFFCMYFRNSHTMPQFHRTLLH